MYKHISINLFCGINKQWTLVVNYNCIYFITILYYSCLPVVINNIISVLPELAMSSGSEEEMSSGDEVYSDDEGNDSGQGQSDFEGSESGQGLSDESEIEDDESGSDADDTELVAGSRYICNTKINFIIVKHDFCLAMEYFIK